MSNYKVLGKPDNSAFEFNQELLEGQPLGGCPPDGNYYHPTIGRVVLEYLLCEESQFTSSETTPHNSHPKKYWHKNSGKFLSLYDDALAKNGILLLVNYAKKGTRLANQISMIEVLDMDLNGITNESVSTMTRVEYKNWFTTFNRECYEAKMYLRRFKTN